MSESHTTGQTPAVPSYGLDALETTLQTDRESLLDGPQEPSEDEGVTFRHSGWTSRRNCVQRALETLDASESRSQRFDSCGSRAWVLESVDEPGVFRISCDRCRDRFCQPCALQRARHIATCVGDFAKGKELRLITLTLRKTGNNISEDVNRIYAGFTRLRRRVLWSKSQRGGVYFIEIKRRRNDDGWHTHIHVLSEGRYINKKKLSDAWLDITGDSMIVDVKWCDSGEDAARYVAKYAGKGVHGSCYHDPEILSEAIVAIKGRRLVGKWGTWRSLAFDTDVPPGEWVGVDSLRRLIDRSLRRDPVAIGILAQLKGGDKCTTDARDPPGPGGCRSSSISNRDVLDVPNSFNLA